MKPADSAPHLTTLVRVMARVVRLLSSRFRSQHDAAIRVGVAAYRRLHHPDGSQGCIRRSGSVRANQRTQHTLTM